MPRKARVNQSQVESQILKLAESASASEAGSEAQYEKEKNFLESFRQQILADQAAFDLTEGAEKHTWRKGILVALLLLTCGWLMCVIVLVCLSATSLSLTDRKELLALEVLHPAMKARFCPVFFKLSDTVLVSFITSTTVSVLGLFLVAAKWLFPSVDSKRSKVG